MIKCGKCQKLKPESDFSWRNDRQRYQHYCKQCQSEYRKEHYLQNKQKYVDKASSWKESEKIRFYSWLQEQSCVDCGISDIRLLEFDHLKDKDFSISKKIGLLSLEALQTELSKCEIVCANCHKIRTADRGKFYKYMG